jgi:hypothetical protein
VRKWRVSHVEFVLLSTPLNQGISVGLIIDHRALSEPGDFACLTLGRRANRGNPSRLPNYFLALYLALTAQYRAAVFTALDQWFAAEILPHEGVLTRYRPKLVTGWIYVRSHGQLREFVPKYAIQSITHDRLVRVVNPRNSQPGLPRRFNAAAGRLKYLRAVSTLPPSCRPSDAQTGERAVSVDSRPQYPPWSQTANSLPRGTSA